MVVPTLVNHLYRLRSDRGLMVVARTALDQPPHCPCRGCLVAVLSGDRTRGLPLQRTPALTNDALTDARVKLVDQVFFDRVAAMAMKQPRLRQNYKFLLGK